MLISLDKRMNVVLVAMLMISSAIAKDEVSYLYDCSVPYETIRLVAVAERHIKRDIGYPYLISFNSKNKDIQEILKGFKYERLDSRTIDCKSESNCINITKKLISFNQVNLDLGAFQQCYRYFKYEDMSNYFSLKKSYKKTCNILEDLIKRYGYSWDTIGMYHNRKSKEKERWLKLISQKVKNAG